MQTITNATDLKKAILQLEAQQASELILLKEEFDATLDSLKPVNLIKNAFKDVVSAPDLKTDVINAAIGLTTGILTKKLMIGKTINPFKKLLGIVVEMAVAKKVTQNAEEIKLTGSNIFNALFRKKTKEPVDQ